MMTFLRVFCLFLVVTPLCAAPAASPAPAPSLRPVASLALVKRDTEGLSPSRFTCDKSGIYADQDTGCQVFHFCQDDGRMDSFFCPNLTLFNQRFFVCDWSYNVDCSVAHEFYHLNDGLYLTSPEQISQAISPAIRISQDELLAGSASSVHASPGLGLTSGVDNTLTPGASGLRQGKSLPASPLSPGVSPAVSSDQAPTYTSDPAASIYYDDVADPEPVSVIAASAASVYNDAVADPEPAGYYSAPASYDDAVADPEPQAYYDAIAAGIEYDPSADPEPYGYPGAYDASDPEPAPAAPVLASGAYDGSSNSVASSAYDGSSNSVVLQSTSSDFYDAVADPEPAGYYDPGYPGSDPEPGADPEYYQY